LKTEANGFADSIWGFFSSLKLTIFLLIGLAAVSIIGTVIPQQGTSAFENYLRTISTSTHQFYDRLGFFDMYHSWWFTVLLCMLCMNLIACSLRRLPHDWKSITQPPMILDEALERSLPLSTSLKVGDAAADMEQKASLLLRQEFAPPTASRRGREIHLFAQKGRFGRIGVYVLHASIIVIFTGVIIGSLFGYETYVEIAEGGSVTRIGTAKGRTIDLGYTLRCDSFAVSYYETGVPREYKSVLSVTEKGRTIVDRRAVVVNRPLTFRGTTFYQSGYRPAVPPAFHVTVRDRSTGSAARITARQGETVSLPGGGSFRPVEYVPEVRPSFPHASGPALLAEFIPAAGEPQAILLLQRRPEFDARRGGDLVFTCDSIDEAWITGLKVVKDPGVWVVWLGCLLLVGGLFAAFFLSHRRIWIRIAGGRVAMAGSARRSHADFKVFFENLADKLQKM
jgi:cytochrome c biogenesis protein